MIGKAVGTFFATLRDALARGLVSCRVTPNMLTLAGCVLNILTGVCLAWGVKTMHPFFFALAIVLLYWCAACDMLDGAVARIGGKSSKFGAFLDSTTDRISDFALWAGLAFGYAWLGKPNLTFMLLSMIAFLNSFLISYTKARAEDMIESCPVGYWQRGERFAAVIFGIMGMNPGALILQQAISPVFTWLRRANYTRQVLAGKTPPVSARSPQARWYHKIQPWLYPRISLPYDFITILNIIWLIWAPINPARLDIFTAF